jgi:hypothetical protein
MDNSGKIIWARHNEIQTANVKGNAEDSLKDGERISMPTKELGSCEIYPQTLQHSPNGRYCMIIDKRGDASLFSSFSVAEDLKKTPLDLLSSVVMVNGLYILL